MSIKIYNEVITKFNDKTQKWETISEDSFDYSGPMALAGYCDSTYFTSYCATTPCIEGSPNACCVHGKFMNLETSRCNDLTVDTCDSTADCWWDEVTGTCYSDIRDTFKLMLQMSLVLTYGA